MTKILLFSLALVLLVWLVFAEPRQRQHRPAFSFAGFGLDLNEDQRDLLEQIRYQASMLRSERDQHAGRLQLELTGMLLEETFKKEDILETLDAQMQSDKQTLELLLNSLSDLHATLTHEQRLKMVQHFDRKNRRVR